MTVYLGEVDQAERGMIRSHERLIPCSDFGRRMLAHHASFIVALKSDLESDFQVEQAFAWVFMQEIDDHSTATKFIATEIVVNWS